ncbi:CYTH and CHAD domain-containing protein [Piscinibacter terrae]|uniref:CHAD domain-containing protein n=1 Tax=Piscinibacter terrae TaxID=2496871 RepID=A0A3N7JZN3_9BURK|nr:CYTH and CHAD domain-containing protein [Albitalea terrae]RQP26239.1 CHAD domain-containing protein [Albitalea terrae]
MREIELKFQVPPQARAAVDAAVAGAARPPRVRLQAAYFDTADRALARVGLALRVRREGRRLVQTLKGLEGDGITRSEHNVNLSTAAVNAADPSLHADTPVGQRLAVVLRDSSPLVMTFRTDIRRRTRAVRTRHGMVEIAFDDGVITAGEEQLAVCELEIELLSGSPLAVLAAARTWVKRHGLWLDTRGKAERGDMLSRGEPVAPPRKASGIELDKDAGMDDAMRRVVLSCLEQISVNASQISSGEHSDEHVHQLRVGLRRLRTAWRLFGLEEPAPQIDDAATQCFRALGASRDSAVVAGFIADELHQAMAAIGLSWDLPRVAADQGAAPVDIVRDFSCQALMLSLFEWTQGLGTVASPSLQVLEKELARDHKKVVAGLAEFTTLDHLARHKLRKRAKRLRYGLEFLAPLLDGDDVRRTLKALKKTLDELGRYMDLSVAIDACKPQADDATTRFAIGWLAARREALIAEIPALAGPLKKRRPVRKP